MNIYIITTEPFPNGMAATNRIKCLAKVFLSQGINCKVIIFRRNGINDNYESIGEYEGIPYEYIGNSVKQKRNRYIEYIRFLIMKLLLLKQLSVTIKKDDFVYGFYGASNLFRKLIIRITHNRGGYYISELCEYPYGTGKKSMKTNNQRKYALKKVFPLFDGVVAISENLLELAKRYCSKQCVIIKVPILVDYEKYDLQDNSSLSKTPFIFHSGTLTEQKDGVLGMIEAFGIAVGQTDKNIQFVLAGKKENSPCYKQINNLIEKYNIQDRVHFTGYLTFDKLKKPLSEASLVILNKYPTEQNHYGFSTKLGEYLAAGKPIIITRVGEAMNWLSDGINAYIIDSNNTSLLANAIVNAFENVEERKRIGQQAKLLCKESFDYRVYEKKMYDFLTTILGTKKTCL